MLSAWNTNNVALYTFMLPFGVDDGYPTVPLLVAIISLSHMLFRSERVPERRYRFFFPENDSPLPDALAAVECAGLG